MEIEIARLHRADAADFLRPADHRPPVRMGKEQGRGHLFRHQALRIAVHPHAAFFQHHIAFGAHIGVGEIEIDHAIRLQPHGKAEMVLGDLFVERGVIVRGEGIILPAIARDDLRKLRTRHGFGAAEHHMLEEMGKAGIARRIVVGTDTEPQHLRHHRRAVIGHHQHLHAVLQRELECPGGVVVRRGGNRRGQRAADERGSNRESGHDTP